MQPIAGEEDAVREPAAILSVVDDASIRAALRELGERHKFRTPDGCVAVTFDALAARGLDPEEVVRWAKPYGGYVDRREYAEKGAGPIYGKRHLFLRLVVPEAALRD